ncbi:Ribosomal large subunit pseudouridine synthase B [Candidatus Erwinia haradaeae]|uniref:Pseudouridine synthase n=1 Tax=Candidatus Erwinia haradaeae TaxID=1922217 RepID=A0A451D3M7_9GAMM|nr:23S rRNA pseudouridine(2605) synthase RluB [Candidatus Erwinia haradaeae]VFP80267.1 Ribosomal large subunit pseudouridine synthase B [Candidatus Erwinia haradaeae]
MTEKLQKILARAGCGSRRAIENMISSGRVRVNNKLAILGDRVAPRHLPKISIDNHVVSNIASSLLVASRVIAYHKLDGELCTRYDRIGRHTVFNRLPKLKGSRWVLVGRLDINTVGLLLLTTDGELAYRLMHPKYAVEREYMVRVFGVINNKEFKFARSNINLKDKSIGYKSLEFISGEGINRWYKMILVEGRNREIRRFWEALGAQVSRLIRVRYGSMVLPRDLLRGDWRELDLFSVNSLRNLVGLEKIRTL